MSGSTNSFGAAVWKSLGLELKRAARQKKKIHLYICLCHVSVGKRCCACVQAAAENERVVF